MICGRFFQCHRFFSLVWTLTSCMCRWRKKIKPWISFKTWLNSNNQANITSRFVSKSRKKFVIVWTKKGKENDFHHLFPFVVVLLENDLSSKEKWFMKKRFFLPSFKRIFFEYSTKKDTFPWETNSTRGVGVKIQNTAWDLRLTYSYFMVINFERMRTIIEVNQSEILLAHESLIYDSRARFMWIEKRWDCRYHSYVFAPLLGLTFECFQKDTLKQCLTFLCVNQIHLTDVFAARHPWRNLSKMSPLLHSYLLTTSFEAKQSHLTTTTSVDVPCVRLRS